MFEFIIEQSAQIRVFPVLRMQDYKRDRSKLSSIVATSLSQHCAKYLQSSYSFNSYRILAGSDEPWLTYVLCRSAMRGLSEKLCGRERKCEVHETAGMDVSMHYNLDGLQRTSTLSRYIVLSYAFEPKLLCIFKLRQIQF